MCPPGNPNPIELGKAEVIKEGKDITVVAIGKMVSRAIEVCDILKDISIEVINARFLRPLDTETILKSIEKTKKVITIEDNIIDGGLGTAVMKLINESVGAGLVPVQIKIKTFAYNNQFIEHGKVEELEKKYGLNPESIANYILTL